MLENNQEIKKALENNPYLRQDLEMMEKEMKKDELGTDLEKAKKLILKAKVTNETAFLKLIEDINKKAERYLSSLIESYNVNERKTIILNLKEEKYGELVHTKDQEQKMAHNVLIESLHILFRNCIKNNINGIEQIAQKYTESKENLSFRNKIKKLAIFHIWSTMRKNTQISN